MQEHPPNRDCSKVKDIATQLHLPGAIELTSVGHKSRSIQMYQLKPIIQHDQPIDLPTSMYTLQSIQGTAASASRKSTSSSAAANVDVSSSIHSLRPTINDDLLLRIQHALQVVHYSLFCDCVASLRCVCALRVCAFFFMAWHELKQH